MPYEVKEHDSETCDEIADDGYDVVNELSHEVKDHHESKPDADRQVRILSELEKEGDE